MKQSFDWSNKKRPNRFLSQAGISTSSMIACFRSLSPLGGSKRQVTKLAGISTSQAISCHDSALAPPAHPIGSMIAFRRGMALFMVIGFLLFIGLIAIYLNFFSKHQMQQTRDTSNAEVCYRAAAFSARQTMAYLQRTADYINSSDPATIPKLAKAPPEIKQFIEFFFDADGLMKKEPLELKLSVEKSPLKFFLNTYQNLEIKVIIKSTAIKPLHENPSIPGLKGLDEELRGRFVIIAEAAIKNTARKVITRAEFRYTNLTLPVVGRFSLMAMRGIGNPNSLSATAAGTSWQTCRLPPELSVDSSRSPLLINGGQSVTDLNSIVSNPAGFLNKQGWIFLGTPDSSSSSYWTLNAAPSAPPVGEGFALGKNTAFAYALQQGGEAFGIAYNHPRLPEPLEVYRKYEVVVFLTGAFADSKTQKFQYAFENTEQPIDNYSILQLMGSNASISPNLVFGNVYRRYLMMKTIRRIRTNTGPDEYAILPYVTSADFSRNDLGITGFSPLVADLIQTTCAGHNGYSTVMSQVITAPANEAVAQCLNSSANSLKPEFRSGTIERIAREISFSATVPEQMLFNSECRLFRDGGQEIYSGNLADSLPNIGQILISRAAREFDSDVDLIKFLKKQIAARKPVTGIYRIKNDFNWTEDFNSLALGGIIIVADGNVRVSAGIGPVTNSGIPDAVNNQVALASLNGNLIIRTSAPINAALLAPRGRLSADSGGFNIRGQLAVAELDLASLENKAIKSINFEKSFDWADSTSYQNGFRLLLEDQQMFYSVKPK
ncbi:MAG: hypothetical protein ACOYXC_16235 [Candidatus Rifleibacteriota bacterium]